MQKLGGTEVTVHSCVTHLYSTQTATIASKCLVLVIIGNKFQMVSNDMRLAGKVQGTPGHWAARCEFESGKLDMCTNLDSGARAGPVPFLLHESIFTSSVCTV
jgi:hypothetical protein